MTLLLPGFVAQQVPTKRASVFGFARRRQLETLLHSFMCLLLWHVSIRLNLVEAIS